MTLSYIMFIFVSNNLIAECPTLSKITNGVVTIASNRVLGVAMYSCELGYLLNGTTTRVCTEQGLWSGNEPVCNLPGRLILVLISSYHWSTDRSIF